MEIEVNNATATKLKSFIERIENLEAEKSDIADNIKDIYLEAKNDGFESKVIRKIISLRKLDESERKMTEELLEVYMNAIGMS